MRSLRISFICTLLSKSCVILGIFAFWKDVSGDFEENGCCVSAHFAAIQWELCFSFTQKVSVVKFAVYDALLDFWGTKEDCMNHTLASLIKFSKEFQFHNSFM